jgi:hypothetical protein
MSVIVGDSSSLILCLSCRCVVMEATKDLNAVKHN